MPGIHPHCDVVSDKVGLARSTNYQVKYTEVFIIFSVDTKDAVGAALSMRRTTITATAAGMKPSITVTPSEIPDISNQRQNRATTVIIVLNTYYSPPLLLNKYTSNACLVQDVPIIGLFFKRIRFEFCQNFKLFAQIQQIPKF